MALGNVWAVFDFEWRRALTIPRIALGMALMLFPVFIALLIRLAGFANITTEVWTGLLFALVPMVTAMLGTFLWAAPAISAELERGSWIYVAVRPGGRSAVLLGKYLAAVAWVLPAALLSLTIAVAVANTGDAWRVWSIVARITCLSVPAYAAVYLLLGTLFTRRSMVAAVAYTLVFELGVSMIPAIINKLTVQYRLRALFVSWTDVTIDHSMEGFSTLHSLLGDAPPSWHVVVLIAYTLACLVAAVILVRKREFEIAHAADV